MSKSDGQFAMASFSRNPGNASICPKVVPWFIYDTIEEFNVDSKAECVLLTNLAHVARKIWKEVTKTNTRQCPLSSVQVQDPWRQSPEWLWRTMLVLCGRTLLPTHNNFLAVISLPYLFANCHYSVSTIICGPFQALLSLQMRLWALAWLESPRHVHHEWALAFVLVSSFLYIFSGYVC